jgi:hypothetical protein
MGQEGPLVDIVSSAAYVDRKFGGRKIIRVFCLLQVASLRRLPPQANI